MAANSQDQERDTRQRERESRELRQQQDLDTGTQQDLDMSPPPPGTPYTKTPTNQDNAQPIISTAGATHPTHENSHNFQTHGTGLHLRAAGSTPTQENPSTLPGIPPPDIHQTRQFYQLFAKNPPNHSYVPRAGESRSTTYQIPLFDNTPNALPLQDPMDYLTGITDLLERFRHASVYYSSWLQQANRVNSLPDEHQARDAWSRILQGSSISDTLRIPYGADVYPMDTATGDEAPPPINVSPNFSQYPRQPTPHPIPQYTHGARPTAPLSGLQNPTHNPRPTNPSGLQDPPPPEAHHDFATYMQAAFARFHATAPPHNGIIQNPNGSLTHGSVNWVTPEGRHDKLKKMK
jgi:hypothetical protein